MKIYDERNQIKRGPNLLMIGLHILWNDFNSNSKRRNCFWCFFFAFLNCWITRTTICMSEIEKKGKSSHLAAAYKQISLSGICHNHWSYKWWNLKEISRSAMNVQCFIKSIIFLFFFCIGNKNKIEYPTKISHHRKSSISMTINNHSRIYLIFFSRCCSFVLLRFLFLSFSYFILLQFTHRI